MHQTDAEEAETALLMLGASLKWSPHTPGFDIYPGFLWELAGAGKAGFYEVKRLNAGDGVMVYFYAQDSNHAQSVYANIARAKAACEIHRATGAFPPVAEPEPMPL